MQNLGSAKTFEVNEKIQSILKISGDNYSFLAIPTEILEKYKVKEFDIIENENKINLVAHTWRAELTSESNHTANEVLS